MTPNAHEITHEMLRADKDDIEIISRLQNLNVHPSVIQECLGERTRREKLFKKRINRKNFSLKRIRKHPTNPNRILELHPTLGWRDFRKVK